MLTAVIIAKNEAASLPECLASLKFCDRILVIDNQSADATAKVALALHARVLKFAVSGDFAMERNFALDQVKSGWVLFVDADETVPADLAQEIVNAIKNPRIHGYFLPRIDFMWGRQLKYGDTGTVNLLRLGQAGQGRWSGRVHETWQISGPAGRLSHPLIHRPHPTLEKFLQKINFYSSVRAGELYDAKKTASIWQVIVYPPAKFVFLWLVKLGFLDGMPGLIHAMTMAFYTFLVRGKLYLLNRGIPSTAS